MRGKEIEFEFEDEDVVIRDGKKYLKVRIDFKFEEIKIK